jgi:TetR/AcrR family transcriptional repressor of nem operon
MAMIEKFSNSKLDTLNDYCAKASKLSNDPLQQLLIFVGLIQEQHAQLEQEEIGCLYASYCYENQLIDKDIEEMVSSTMLKWKNKFSSKIREVMAVYPPAMEIDPDEVAGMFLATLEGAYIMARIMPERDAVETYLEQYKTYLQVLFKQP